MVVSALGALVLGGAGWLYFAGDHEEAGNHAGANVVEADPGPLDGMTFKGTMGPSGQPKDVQDTFVFAKGTFVSKECELQCDYPARPYFVREDDGRVHFVSETRCPYKDAKIVWRGTVNGERIEGVSTWTVRRWYWTIERDFDFAGTLVGRTAPVASVD